MAKKRKSKQSEPDSVYFLKIILFFVLGGVWIAFDSELGVTKSIPIGFIIGNFFAAHDHFQIDRKIEYAVLLVAMFMGFWLPLGAELTLH